MDAILNPFRPGADRVLPELAGRNDLQAEFCQRLYRARESGEGERPWILSGLRGAGKTVLLHHLGREAAQLKLVFMKVEASRAISLPLSLSKELQLALRKLLSPHDRAEELWSRAARVLRSFHIKLDPTGAVSFAIDIEPERGVADSGDLAVALQELFEVIGAAARPANSVTLIADDEIQDASAADLTALNVALHNLGQYSLPVPVVFVGAGLPSLPAVLADATSYAERLYDYRRIGLLDAAATMDALDWASTRYCGVVGRRRSSSGGSCHRWLPIFHTSVRKSCLGCPHWRHCHPRRCRSWHRARDEVERGLYESRWDRATPTQRAFMIAHVARRR
jgi:hypothetical protein